MPLRNIIGKTLPLTVFLALGGSAVSCSDSIIAPEPPAPVRLIVSDSPRETTASYLWIGVEADGEWTLSLSFEDDAAPWATLRHGSGSGNAIVGCDYEANTGTSPRTMTVNLVGASGNTDSKTVTQKGYGMVRWIEMPAPRADLFVGSHSFPYLSGGQTRSIRNYSFGYLPSKRVALWVAYPLNNFYTQGSAKHDTGWLTDNVLPDSIRIYQPFLYLGSYNGDYDRGHQCPAADRHCCDEALDQTYFCTNSTPQHADFNQGLWVSVESRVRAYSAKCDTLYVVTGCIMDGTEPPTHDKGGNTCPIPGHYYKALLARGGRADGWTAAGLIFDHKADRYRKTIGSENICSIDRLEELTGLDFFPSLELFVGEDEYNAIEAASPYSDSFWGFK